MYIKHISLHYQNNHLYMNMKEVYFFYFLHHNHKYSNNHFLNN